jgi:hypothetical protein
MRQFMINQVFLALRRTQQQFNTFQRAGQRGDRVADFGA